MKQRSERMFVQILCKSKNKFPNRNRLRQLIVIFLETKNLAGSEIPQGYLVRFVDLKNFVYIGIRQVPGIGHAFEHNLAFYYVQPFPEFVIRSTCILPTFIRELKRVG
jgi:hypothetical protein